MSLRAEVLERIRQMPALPAGVTELIPLLQNPDFDAEAASRIISYDPGLTAHVLRIANSAAFGTGEEISSVLGALMQLGAKRILSAITSSAVAPVAIKPVDGYDIREGALWESCIAVALATEVFAEILDLPANPQAFTAGLLSDIGKIALGTFVEDKAAKLGEMAFDEGLPYDQAERELLGVDHAEAGAVLLEAWGLPEIIVQPVRWHHEPDRCPDSYQGIVDIVHVANYTCLMSGLGGGEDGTNYLLSTAAAERLGLTPKILEQGIGETICRLDEVRHLFGLTAAEAES